MLLVDEKSPIGQFVSERNRGRQYDFLHTTFRVAQELKTFPLDKDFLCDLNLYAVQYLSKQPGKYRENYNVTVGEYAPPEWQYVEELMAVFFNNLSRLWNRMEPLESAAYALWAINHIHPFAQGNGRASRAFCYFIICQRIGDWLPGDVTMLERIRLQERPLFCEILSRMDARKQADGTSDVSEMTQFLDRLLLAQLVSKETNWSG